MFIRNIIISSSRLTCSIFQNRNFCLLYIVSLIIYKRVKFDIQGLRCKCITCNGIRLFYPLNIKSQSLITFYRLDCLFLILTDTKPFTCLCLSRIDCDCDIIVFLMVSHSSASIRMYNCHRIKAVPVLLQLLRIILRYFFTSIRAFRHIINICWYSRVLIFQCIGYVLLSFISFHCRMG